MHACTRISHTHSIYQFPIVFSELRRNIRLGNAHSPASMHRGVLENRRGWRRQHHISRALPVVRGPPPLHIYTPYITAIMRSYFVLRYLEFNQPPLIEVKLSKKEIIGRLKQQKDNIRESKPQAQQVAATLSIQCIYIYLYTCTLNPYHIS